ncbi:MAG: hypothetical protein ACLUTH_10200 [Blautia massiliensis (ex Durand et al. 2017)]
MSQGSHVLRVYNAGEYMDLSLIDKFEKQYNCTIVYETFESNEMMYTKLASGETYDVLVPSDYMIERLIKEEYLQSIDWKKIPNKQESSSLKYRTRTMIRATAIPVRISGEPWESFTIRM